MARRAAPHATEAELEILQVLWQRGACTVREIQEHLEAIRPTGYTTVLKLLQIMHEKELVTRDGSSRAHVYEAAVSQDDTQQKIVDHFVDRVFSGSTSQLVFHALASGDATPEELEEIQKLLDNLKEDQS